MKPELAFRQSNRIGRYAMAFQDAINTSLGYNVPNAGYYGASANLPTDAGPVEPPILFNGPTATPSPNPTWNPAWNNNAGSYAPPGYDIAGFGGNTGLGNDLFSSLDSMGFGSGYGDNGYVPSDIMQAYMDFYASNPQASGATAPGAYPAPGTGATDNQSFIRKILSVTPQGKLGQFLRDKIAANQARVNMQANPGSWQGPPAVPPGGALFGYNPSSGGGGGTPRYDFATGRTSATPSTNPLYTTGGGWQPVANAPADIRFSPNSGTGNYQADLTTKNFELGGGYANVPNRPGTSDRGHDRFYGAIMQMADPGDSTGGFTQAALSGSPEQSAQSRDLYQQALRAVPMGTDGFTVPYIQKVNDWIAANQPASLFAALNPTAISGNTISGPPRLPGT